MCVYTNMFLHCYVCDVALTCQPRPAVNTVEHIKRPSPVARRRKKQNGADWNGSNCKACAIGFDARVMANLSFYFYFSATIIQVSKGKIMGETNMENPDVGSKSWT